MSAGLVCGARTRSPWFGGRREAVAADRGHPRDDVVGAIAFNMNKAMIGYQGGLAAVQS